MATDERKNIVDGENEQAEDSGVFDIFFIQNEDGEVVVTTENPNMEPETEKGPALDEDNSALSEAEETAVLSDESEPGESQENAQQSDETEAEADAEPETELEEETETEADAEPETEPAYGGDPDELTVEPLDDANEETQDSDDGAADDGSDAKEISGLDEEKPLFDENFDDFLDSDGENDEIGEDIPEDDTEIDSDEKLISAFTDPFDNPLGTSDDEAETDKEAELFGEELDAEIQSMDRNLREDVSPFEEDAEPVKDVPDEPADALPEQNTDDVVITSIEETSDAAPDELSGTDTDEDEKAPEARENEKEAPSALEKLKQSIEKVNDRNRWKDNDPNGKADTKTVLGIDYKVWAIIISAMFTLDAILANVVCHWGVYYIVDKLLKLSGVAALKLETESYQSFSVVISYVVTFILGGFLMFLLMNVTKRLLSSVEFRGGTALVKVVVTILLVIFLIGTLVSVASGHAFSSLNCYRFASPLFMYIGALLFYALSNIKFNQDY